MPSKWRAPLPSAAPPRLLRTRRPRLGGGGVLAVRTWERRRGRGPISLGVPNRRVGGCARVVGCVAVMFICQRGSWALEAGSVRAVRGLGVCGQALSAFMARDDDWGRVARRSGRKQWAVCLRIWARGCVRGAAGDDWVRGVVAQAERAARARGSWHGSVLAPSTRWACASRQRAHRAALSLSRDTRACEKMCGVRCVRCVGRAFAAMLVSSGYLVRMAWVSDVWCAWIGSLTMCW